MAGQVTKNGMAEQYAATYLSMPISSRMVGIQVTEKKKE